MSIYWLPGTLGLHTERLSLKEKRKKCKNNEKGNYRYSLKKSRRYWLVPNTSYRQQLLWFSGKGAGSSLGCSEIWTESFQLSSY